VIFGADELARAFLIRHIPMFRPEKDSRGLCVLSGQDVVAAVLFERWNGVHVEASLAAEEGRTWATRRTLHSIFFYPFRTLGVEKITICVPQSNDKARKMNRQLGFIEECRVSFAAHDGTDLVIMKMTRNECRWLGHGQGKQRTRTP